MGTMLSWTHGRNYYLLVVSGGDFLGGVVWWWWSIVRIIDFDAHPGQVSKLLRTSRFHGALGPRLEGKAPSLAGCWG